jgi:acetyl-CoA acetyltransferase family protein
VACAARAIKSGEISLAIAGGVEGMSRAPFIMPKPDTAFSRSPEIADSTIGWRFVNPRMQAAYGTDSMPETAENLADDHVISRADQDAFALRSQQRAGIAQTNGRFALEILPVMVPAGRGKQVEVTQDEHPRGDTTAQDLARLRPITRSGGTVTAGNASGVNDGAAALLIANAATATAHGLRPIARILGATSAGVAPRVMGYGPVPAVQKLLAQTGIALADLAVIELNEAFAAQALAVLRGLGLADDDPRVNPNGGAIALGHPLGMSGARILGTAALELRRNGGRFGLATMCVGVGQGAAVLIERV